MGRTTFTSFHLEYIEEIKKLNSKARVGWLTDKTDDETINALINIGGEEIAPYAENITQTLVEKWKKAGLGVRAWGVGSIATMKRMCSLKVDGMTVNFPDRLYQHLNSCR